VGVIILSNIISTFCHIYLFTFSLQTSVAVVSFSQNIILWLLPTFSEKRF